jgi:hypothetical protein
MITDETRALFVVFLLPQAIFPSARPAPAGQRNLKLTLAASEFRMPLDAADRRRRAHTAQRSPLATHSRPQDSSV